MVHIVDRYSNYTNYDIAPAIREIFLEATSIIIHVAIKFESASKIPETLSSEEKIVKIVTERCEYAFFSEEAA